MSALDASLNKVFDSHDWCPSGIVRSFKHMVRRMNTRMGSVDVAISGSTMVQTILCQQWHTSDVDIYITPDKVRIVWAWLWNTLRLIFVNSKTRNYAYVRDRAHPRIRHIEGYALLPVDGTSFIDCRSNTTWTFNLGRAQCTARVRKQSDNEEYDSDYEAVSVDYLGDLPCEKRMMADQHKGMMRVDLK